MEINALRTFLEVAKTRHFANSAETLFVSQSTVSARIKTLEEELGVDLFIRERGNIQLTAAGEALVTHAKSIMSLWTRAKQDVSVTQGKRAKLILGGLSGLWDITLQDWLVDISSAHPDLALTADIFSAKNLYTKILDGSIDLAFLYDAPQGINIVSRPLKTIKLRLVSSEPITVLTEGWEKDLIQVDWGANFAVQFAAEFPSIRNSKIVTGLGRIAQQYIKKVDGYAYLAETAVQQSVDDGELFYVPNTPSFKRKAYAIYHQDNEQSALIQELLEHL